MCKYSLIRKLVLISSVVVFVRTSQVAAGITVWGGVEAKNFAFMRAWEKYHSDLVGLAIIAGGGWVAIVSIISCIGSWFRIRWCLVMVSGYPGLYTAVLDGDVLDGGGGGRTLLPGVSE